MLTQWSLLDNKLHLSPLPKYPKKINQCSNKDRSMGNPHGTPFWGPREANITLVFASLGCIMHALRLYRQLVKISYWEGECYKKERSLSCSIQRGCDMNPGVPVRCSRPFHHPFSAPATTGRTRQTAQRSKHHIGVCFSGVHHILPRGSILSWYEAVS